MKHAFLDFVIFRSTIPLFSFCPFAVADSRSIVSDKVPDHVLLDFKRRSGVKANVDLPLQAIGLDNAVEFPDGSTITLDDLSPISVFTDSADCFLDGQNIPCPEPSVFSKVDQQTGLKVVVTKGKSGAIESIKAKKPDGSTHTLQAVTSSVLAYISEIDLDPEFDARFILKDESVRRNLRAEINDQLATSENRNLQSSCTSYRVIEVAVAAESSYCSDVGGSANVESAVQRIIADVSFDYEQPGLCFKAQISHFKSYCDSGTDPYTDVVSIGTSGCGDYGVLDKFQEYWNNDRSGVHRDLAELFSGTGLECLDNGACVIGCAFVGTACSSFAGYGVNYVTYTTNTVRQSNLVAHEIGHTVGANHDSGSTDYIMYPSISGTERFFSATSVASFLSRPNSCITELDTSPTTSPTVLPPTSSSPTRDPTTAIPTMRPSFSPTKSLTTESPTIRPTFPPTPMPTIHPTFPPTSRPTSSSPTESPTTAWPTVRPTFSPTESPMTGTPTTTIPCDCSYDKKYHCNNDVCCIWTGNPGKGSCGPA